MVNQRMVRSSVHGFATSVQCPASVKHTFLLRCTPSCISRSPPSVQHCLLGDEDRISGASWHYSKLILSRISLQSHAAMGSE